MAQCEEILRAAQIEFHPCDACNLVCRGCTYGHDDPAIGPYPAMFPFKRLDLLQIFQPRALVITGGGEPTLYRDSETQATFSELVKVLRMLLPECKFALITNGARSIKPATASEFTWLRISVDAATPETYRCVRGRDLFQIVCDNLLTVLRESEVPQVNVGFVFSAENGHEIAGAARFFRDLVLRECPGEIGRLCIDYRPLRRDPADRHVAFPEGVNLTQVDAAHAGFLALEEEAGDGFIEEQTNWRDVVFGYGDRPRTPRSTQEQFTRCGYAGIYRLVRANGDVRPCCMRLLEPEFDLGNLLHDPPEVLARNILHISRGMPPGCGPHNCRLASLNHIIEFAVDGKQQRSPFPEIRENPFF